MELSVVVPALAAVAGLGCLGVFVYSLYNAPRQDFRNLMASNPKGMSATAYARAKLADDESGEEFEKLKLQVRKTAAKPTEPTLEEKMFRAGIFSEQQRKDFKRLQVLTPAVLGILGADSGKLFGGFDMVLLVGVMGGVLGFLLPFRVLNRRIKERDQEILFYLPLVIEQISIGVSSSLDVGPCVARVVQMADERDSHNPVTELLRYAQYHIKSGVGMEEALDEIGKLSGNVDVKHTFMALSQVSKFGGEVSRQLQELADAVSAAREVKIDEKIKKLELEATAPVALVFFGYIVILLIGFGLQIITAI
jgi:Flp pilus assembly protein TadB